VQGGEDKGGSLKEPELNRGGEVRYTRWVVSWTASPSHYRYRWTASGQHLALHLFCYVFKNRLLTLRANVGELNSVALLVSPDHSPDNVNGYTRRG